MTYELEAEIADRDGQPAAVIAAYKKALELAEDGWDARSQFILSLTYFFDLKNTELAGKNVPDRWKLFYQSILEPVKALSRLRQLPDVGDRNSSLWPLVYALIQLEHYEEALIALEPKKFGERPLHGNMRIGSSDIWLAYMQAYCQQRLAKVQDAQAMAGRIQQFIAVAVANGEPPNYFHLLAAVQLLMGKDDEAMQSLTQAWENYALDWTDLSSPWYLALHQREEFQALKESMQTHLNGERAKLGWDPVEI